MHDMPDREYGYSHTSKEACEKLYDLVVENKSLDVVELGTGPTYDTSWYLAAAAKRVGGRFRTLDSNPAYVDSCVEDLSKYGLPAEGIAEDVISALKSGIFDGCDFIFVDAGYSDHRIQSISLALPIIAEGGIIAVHDVDKTGHADIRKHFLEHGGKVVVEDGHFELGVIIKDNPYA